MLEELVRPISIFGLTPWRCISLSTPQVVKGCAEIATTSVLARFISRTWVAKLVSASSHSLWPATSKPALVALSFMMLYVALLCAKSFSTPPHTVLRSLREEATHSNIDLYIAASLGTLRNDHSEMEARPPLAATSV